MEINKLIEGRTESNIETIDSTSNVENLIQFGVLEAARIDFCAANSKKKKANSKNLRGASKPACNWSTLNLGLNEAIFRQKKAMVLEELANADVLKILHVLVKNDYGVFKIKIFCNSNRDISFIKNQFNITSSDEFNEDITIFILTGNTTTNNKYEHNSIDVSVMQKEIVIHGCDSLYEMATSVFNVALRLLSF